MSPTGRGLGEVLALAALLTLCTDQPADAQSTSLAATVDLELVLAVDASDSIDDSEFRLQVEGIAAAFRSADVHAAIASGKEKQIAVTLLVWADAWSRPESIGWYLITSSETAESFARAVESHERQVGGSTGMGEGVASAVRLIEHNSILATRRVIDVSGDGMETPRLEQDKVTMMPKARELAEAAGITVNGLAIMTEQPSLDAWYRENVATGHDAFVMTTTDSTAFPEAIQRKLVREIETKLSWLRRRDPHGAGPDRSVQ